MVAFFCPPPFMRSNTFEPFSASYIGVTNAANASATTVTVTGVNIGLPSPSRLVVLAIHTIRSGGSTLTSLTIGGITATIVKQAVASNVGSVIGYALVPSGTTADMVMTFNAAPLANGVRFGVYRIVGANGNVPYSSELNSAGGDGNKTISISTPEGGFALVAATATNGGAISGVTMDYTYTGGNTEVGKSGSLNPTTLSSSVSFTTNTRVMVAASWR